MPTLRDIEILTHCDVNRLNRAYLMARTMPDDLVITLVIGYKNPEDKSYSLENKPKNIHIHFEYYDSDTIYPTNRFRNIAFEKSKRDYVFYLDVDFIFQHDFWSNFEMYYLKELSPERVLCPLPLFDDEMPTYLKGFEPNELVKRETQETHLEILKDEFKKTATLFKFHDRWVTYPQKKVLEDMTPVMRSIRNGTILPEPWGIMHRDRYLFADESFLGRVKDKQQFVCRLLDSGLEFYSMRDCVIYHLWHPDSRYDINREKENCVNTILFNKKYLHKYQNFFFLLQDKNMQIKLTQLLDAFKNNTTRTEVPQGSRSEDVIPILKQRHTIICNSKFYPEYSVYGYKLVYVYDSETKTTIFNCLSVQGSKNIGLFNLGYFATELDINKPELALKKIQDLTGWALMEKGKSRVSLLSPGPENSDIVKF